MKVQAGYAYLHLTQVGFSSPHFTRRILQEIHPVRTFGALARALLCILADVTARAEAGLGAMRAFLTCSGQPRLASHFAVKCMISVLCPPGGEYTDGTWNYAPGTVNSVNRLPGNISDTSGSDSDFRAWLECDG
jgi:hypothetical protein